MTDFQSLVRGAYAGRRFVCGSEILMESAWTARRILDRGGDAIAVAVTRGTGELPEGVDTRCLDLGPVGSMMEGIRRGEAVMANLPADVRAWIDGFDPDGAARAIGAGSGSRTRRRSTSSGIGWASHMRRRVSCRSPRSRKRMRRSIAARAP